MVVHQTALWILIAACSLAGLVAGVRRRQRPSGRGAGALLSAALDGIGVGMGVAFVLLVAAALAVRL